MAKRLPLLPTTAAKKKILPSVSLAARPITRTNLSLSPSVPKQNNSRRRAGFAGRFLEKETEGDRGGGIENKRTGGDKGAML